MQIPIAAFVVAEYMMSRRQSPAHGGGRFRSAHALIEPSGTENGVFGGWALKFGLPCGKKSVIHVLQHQVRVSVRGKGRYRGSGDENAIAVDRR